MNRFQKTAFSLVLVPAQLSSNSNKKFPAIMRYHSHGTPDACPNHVLCIWLIPLLMIGGAVGKQVLTSEAWECGVDCSSMPKPPGALRRIRGQETVVAGGNQRRTALQRTCPAVLSKWELWWNETIVMPGLKKLVVISPRSGTTFSARVKPH